MELLDQIRPFNALEFFEMQTRISKRSSHFKKNPKSKEFLLPKLQHLLTEEAFAEVSIAYDRDGISIYALVEKPFEDVSFPEVQLGDSVEIFIDTRDLKSAAFITKFCHHFVFLPKAVSDLTACEMTKFRSDDTHPLCDSNLLQCHTEFKKNAYEMQLFIPSEALFGYDPQNFKRIGFTYRINRKGGSAMHFNVSSLDYPLEKHPQLWASLLLGDEKI